VDLLDPCEVVEVVAVRAVEVGREAHPRDALLYLRIAYMIISNLCQSTV
jgi:hypothetical protein